MYPAATHLGFCSSGRGVNQCQECQLDDPPSSHPQEPHPQRNPPRLHTAALDQSLNPKPIATRRTRRKRTLSLVEQDLEESPRETRDRARGSRETSRDDSCDARDREAAHFLDGEPGLHAVLLNKIFRTVSLLVLLSCPSAKCFEPLWVKRVDALMRTKLFYFFELLCSQLSSMPASSDILLFCV